LKAAILGLSDGHLGVVVIAASHTIAEHACYLPAAFAAAVTLHRIPPYFALIIRAIGVLEGIALVGDPEFALVDEAYPYIAKRLLTDESPRLQVRVVDECSALLCGCP
jgi:hypothetical protein